MNIEFTFEYPHTPWSVLYVFKGYYEYFLEKNENINVTYINSSGNPNRSPTGVYSAHSMRIKNLDNNKYILVSYWDNPFDFTYDNNGWDHSSCVELIGSSGSNSFSGFTPFSYLPYNKTFDEYTLNAKKLSEKENNRLFFRGYLYGQRLQLANCGLLEITNQKIFPDIEYFNEITNNKICLSLNGAGEICNRDIEILSARSVLLRPKLKLSFYNDFIPDYHYISFEEHPNPVEQSKIIIDKFNEIKDNDELLTFISENGYEWYLNNGTVNSNIEILKKLINLEKLT